MIEQCPDDDTLCQILEDALPMEQAGAISLHLNGCVRCQRALDQLTLWDPVFQHAFENTPCESLSQDSEVSGELKIPGFTVGAILGSGGNGVVYRAVHLRLQRVVAIKRLKSGSATTEPEKQRFRANAEAMARLRHPHIVSLFSIGESGGQPYLEMEYVAGGSLADLPKSPLPSPHEVANALREIALGIQHAHEKGVLHRDLKPGNVLLEPLTQDGPSARLSDFVPKVADFGLAKMLDGPSLGTPSIAILGTPAYMSPEMAFGSSNEVGPWTDIYGIGAVGYELATGIAPFQGATPFDSLIRAREEDPVAPSLLRRGLPRDFETILLKCLDQDPSCRYASAALLAQDLDRFLAGHPVQARPLGRLHKGWRTAKRHPVVAGLAAALAVVILASLGGLTALYGQALHEKNRSDELRKKSDERLGIARGVLKLAAKTTEDRFLYPQTIKPSNKDEILLLYRFHETMLEEFMDDDESYFDCAFGMLQQANMMQNFADLSKAADLSVKPFEALERLVLRNPDNPKYLHRFAEANFQRTAFSEVVSRKNIGFENYQKSLDILSALVLQHPGSGQYRETLSAFERQLVQRLWENQRYDEAIALQLKNLNAFRDLVRAYPENPFQHGYRCEAVFRYGELLSRVRPDPELHLRLMEEVVDDLHDCRRRFPARIDQYYSNMVVFIHIAAVTHYVGRIAETEQAIKQSIDLATKLKEENSDFAPIREFWIGAKASEYFRLALDQPLLADQYAKDWIEELETLCRKHPKNESYRLEMARQLARSNSTAGSARDATRALKIFESVFEDPQLAAHHWEAYAMALCEDAQYQKAIDLILKNEQKRGFSSSVHYEYHLPLVRVNCLWNLKQKEKAAAEFQEISKQMKSDYLVPLHVEWYRRKVEALVRPH